MAAALCKLVARQVATRPVKSSTSHGFGVPSSHRFHADPTSRERLTQVVKNNTRAGKGFFQMKLLNLQNSVTRRWLELPERVRDKFETLAITSCVAAIEWCVYNMGKVVVGAVVGVAKGGGEEPPKASGEVKGEVKVEVAYLALEKTHSEADKMRIEAATMKSEALKMMSEAEKMRGEAKIMKSEAEKMRSEAKIMKSEAEKMRREADNLRFED